MARLTSTLAALALALPSSAARAEPQTEPAGPTRAAEVPAADVAQLVKDPAALVAWLRDRSHEVGAARARVDQARADVGTAGLVPNPTASFSLGDITLGTTNPPGLGFDDTAIYNVGLAETIELGKRGPRVAAARERLAAAHETYLDTFAQNVADARLALGRVAYLGSRQSSLEGSLENARRVLELEKTRVDHGDLAANDYDRLVLETIALEAELSKSRSEYEAALATCAATLRAECSASGAQFADLVSTVAVPEQPGDLDAILAKRPDVRASQHEKSSAHEEAVLAGRKLIPDPNLGVTFTRDKLVISGDQPKTLTFSVSLPIPLFDRGQHDEERAHAREVEVERTEDALLARAHADLGALVTKKARLEKAHESLVKEALPRSAGVLEATMKAFNLGQVSMTELLLAQRGHTALQLSVLDLGFEVFSTRNELRRALGADAELARGSSPATLED